MRARPQECRARRARPPRPALDEVRVNAAYQILFGREPSGEESSLAQEFLRKPANGDASRWEQYAQLLLASNEMLYVD